MDEIATLQAKVTELEAHLAAAKAGQEAAVKAAVDAALVAAKAEADKALADAKAAWDAERATKDAELTGATGKLMTATEAADKLRKDVETRDAKLVEKAKKLAKAEAVNALVSHGADAATATALMLANLPPEAYETDGNDTLTAGAKAAIAAFVSKLPAHLLHKSPPPGGGPGNRNTHRPQRRGWAHDLDKRG